MLGQYRIILSADTAGEVPQPPERCLSRKAGIMRCCLGETAMPTTLLIVYRVLGTVLFALAAAAIVEKYRTVRGAVLLPARVLECRRASSTSNSRGAGGYRYLVELYANGQRLELETNDAFWFRHDKDKGKVLQVWYNPNARCVERKSWETEFFAAVLAVIGAALLLIR